MWVPYQSADKSLGYQKCQINFKVLAAQKCPFGPPPSLHMKLGTHVRGHVFISPPFTQRFRSFRPSPFFVESLEIHGPGSIPPKRPPFFCDMGIEHGYPFSYEVMVTGLLAWWMDIASCAKRFSHESANNRQMGPLFSPRPLTQEVIVE